MAKARAKYTKQNPIDLNNLSKQDQEILNLDTASIMKKYKMEKQAVYDRRFALNKKIKAAASAPEAPAETVVKKKRGPKPGQPRKAKASIPVKVETPADAVVPESRQLVVVSKQVPVIHKPIEINFDNFTVRLNGVPKRISVNPETNAIEIDL